AFSAADLGIGALRQMFYAEFFKRLGGYLVICLAVAGKEGFMRHSSHKHHVKDPVGKCLLVDLRYVRHLPRKLSLRYGMYVTAVQIDFPPDRFQQTDHQL